MNNTQHTTEITHLKSFIKPSTKLIIVITKVSRSGMSRRMKVFTTQGKNQSLLNMTYNVGKACDLSENTDGLHVGGCGMDMAFWLANHITQCLGYDKNKNMKGNGGGCLDWQVIY